MTTQFQATQLFKDCRLHFSCLSREVTVLPSDCPPITNCHLPSLAVLPSQTVTSTPWLSSLHRLSPPPSYCSLHRLSPPPSNCHPFTDCHLHPLTVLPPQTVTSTFLLFPSQTVTSTLCHLFTDCHLHLMTVLPSLSVISTHDSPSLPSVNPSQTFSDWFLHLMPVVISILWFRVDEQLYLLQWNLDPKLFLCHQVHQFLELLCSK